MTLKAVQWIFLILHLFSSSVATQINAIIDTDALKIVKRNGYSKEIISDAQRALFHISDYEIKKCIYAHDGGWPTNIYVRSPTPWGDLYKRYEWSEIKRIVRISKANSQSSNMLIEVNTIDCDIRRHNLIACKFPSDDFTYRVTHTRQSADNVLNLGGKIKYTFHGKATTISDLFTIEYQTESWQGTHVKKLFRNIKPITVTMRDTYLQPGQRVAALLVAQEVTLNLNFTYTAVLAGDIAANYEDRWKGHHFWPYNINKMLVAGKQSLNVSTEESVLIEFLRPYKIEVYIVDTTELIEEIYFDIKNYN